MTADALYLPNQLLGLDKNTSRTAKQAISVLNKEYFFPLATALVGEKTAIYGGGQNAATPFFFMAAGESPAQVASPDNAAQRLQKSWSARGIDNVKLFPAGARGAPVVCGQTQNKDIMLLGGPRELRLRAVLARLRFQPQQGRVENQPDPLWRRALKPPGHGRRITAAPVPLENRIRLGASGLPTLKRRACTR